jgi:hypothetical protein
VLAALAGALGGACDGAAVVAGAGPVCFRPIVADRAFAGSGAWSSEGGVVVTPASARFDAPTLCAHDRLETVIETPPLACATPVVLELGVDLQRGDRVNFEVGVNGAYWRPLLVAGSYVQRVCLGAAAYGGVARLSLGGASNPGFCPAPGDDEGPALVLHSVTIAPDARGACPAVGEIFDADFEAPPGATLADLAPTGVPVEGGWALAGAGGVATIEAGLGVRGSRAAHLHTESLCESPSVTGRVSLPTAAMLPHAALRLWTKGTPGAVASVRVGPRRPAVLLGSTYVVGTGGARTVDVCLPRWALGTVQWLEIGLVDRDFTQRCAEANVRDFVFDELALVSDPACADAAAGVLDPGFELAAAPTNAVSPWTIETWDDVPGGTVTLAPDRDAPRAGRVAAVFRATTPCPRAALSAGVTIPRATETAGPSLSFWIRPGPASHTRPDVSLAAATAPVALPTEPRWTRVSTCLDPRLGGRPDLLRFAIVSPKGGTCADTFPEESFAIDDVALGTDPACPAR